MIIAVHGWALMLAVRPLVLVAPLLGLWIGGCRSAREPTSAEAISVTPPELVRCHTEPTSPVLPEQAVRFVATARSDDSLRYAYDFGDGTSSLEAIPIHAYAAPGSYTTRLTVRDQGGSAACAFELVVAPPECEAGPIEINSPVLHFPRNSVALESAFEYAARVEPYLLENVEFLQGFARCPGWVVQIVGTASTRERNPPRTARARAEAVRAFYLAHGLPPDRVEIAPAEVLEPEAGISSPPGPRDPARRVEMGLRFRDESGAED